MSIKEWLLNASTKDHEEGFYETEKDVKKDQDQKAWWQVMCLTGVDYFSTLGYQPGIAALAAGALAPIATIVLVLVTLFGALPMYRKVSEESPHGDGSLSMLEKLMSHWSSKILVLSLLGFVATGFIITITLSASDAAAHLVENPLFKFLHGQNLIITVSLILALGAVFLKGFKEAIGIAVVLVSIYLVLSSVIIIEGAIKVFNNTELITNWHGQLYLDHNSIFAVIGASLLVFPALALGLSGFETGVVVMPLIKGAETDDFEKPAKRISNTKKLLTTAAVIMSFMLICSAFITTWLIPAEEFKKGGAANGRALAFIAHDLLGNGFGTIYDFSTIGILWFAGASAMAGLLNITPRYLPRYGMAPEWARMTRPLTIVFTLIALLVVTLFHASVDAQAGAYATGVLVLMTSAGIAVMLFFYRKKEWRKGLFFTLVSAIFIYTTVITLISTPSGLIVALLFITAILVVSVFSRASRSTELRILNVSYDAAAQRILDEIIGRPGPVRFFAHKLEIGNDEEYTTKSREVRLDNHLDEREKAMFIEVEIDDASSFESSVLVSGVIIENHIILRAKGPSVANVLAAILIDISIRDTEPAHAYFEWSEKSPGENALRFIFAGQGDVPALTHEILRRAIPDEINRPQCHVG